MTEQNPQSYTERAQAHITAYELGLCTARETEDNLRFLLDEILAEVDQRIEAAEGRKDQS